MRVLVIAAVWCLAGPTLAFGSEPDRPGSPPLPERIEPADEVLQGWIEASRKRGPVKGTARVYRYDPVFFTESRGDVRFWVASPDCWRIDIEPVDVNGEEHHLINGRAYTPRSWEGTKERYVDGALMQLALQPDGSYRHRMCELPSRKSYRLANASSLSPAGTAPQESRQDFFERLREALSAPSDHSGYNAFYTAIFPHEEDGWKSRYEFKLNEERNSTTDEAVFAVISPLEIQDRRAFSKVEVCLKPKTFELQAYKIYDPSGNRETVYAITSTTPISPKDEAFISDLTQPLLWCN